MLAVIIGENPPLSVVMPHVFVHPSCVNWDERMQRFNEMFLPCQYCGQPERRVTWREGKPVTCFSCKTMRRREATNARRARPGIAESVQQSAAAEPLEHAH
jgi:hypothetical protein